MPIYLEVIATEELFRDIADSVHLVGVDRSLRYRE